MDLKSDFADYRRFLTGFEHVLTTRINVFKHALTQAFDQIRTHYFELNMMARWYMQTLQANTFSKRS